MQAPQAIGVILGTCRRLFACLLILTNPSGYGRPEGLSFIIPLKRADAATKRFLACSTSTASSRRRPSLSFVSPTFVSCGMQLPRNGPALIIQNCAHAIIDRVFAAADAFTGTAPVRNMTIIVMKIAA